MLLNFIGYFCELRAADIHIAISLIVLTCESNGLYYSSISFTYDGIFPHLVLKYGVVYVFYM